MSDDATREAWRQYDAEPNASNAATLLRLLIGSGQVPVQARPKGLPCPRCGCGHPCPTWVESCVLCGTLYNPDAPLGALRVLSLLRQASTPEGHEGLREERDRLLAMLDERGGRGIELAERIDEINSILGESEDDSE